MLNTLCFSTQAQNPKSTPHTPPRNHAAPLTSVASTPQATPARGARLLSQRLALVWLASLAVCGATVLASQSVAQDAVLLEFTSNNCRYCEAMEPAIQQLASAGVPIRQINVDREPAMAQRFGIQQLPTFVVFHRGKENSRMVGVQRLETLQQALRDAAQVQMTPTRSRANQPAGTNQPVPAQLASAGAGNMSPISFSGNAAPTIAPTRSAAPTSEPMPSLELAAAVERAQAATVRLRVFFGAGGYDVGTGTIIDRRGQNFLVLTCGHLFRDTGGESRIEIDLFHGGQKQTVAGQLIDFNAKERDIALVSLQTQLDITPVPLLGDRSQLRNGEPVFSFGCDSGADPTRVDTRITAIDKYNQHIGLSNIEISGAPRQGRSGGGLFNARGQLIGVCNAADYKDNIGIYAGPGEVAWQLERTQLTHLLQSPPTQSAIAQTGGVHDPAAMTNQPGGSDALSSSATNAVALTAPANAATANPAAFANASNGLAPSNAGNQEMIVILRDRSQPNAAPQVRVYQRPPAELLRWAQ